MGKNLKKDVALQRAKNADTPQGVIDALIKYGTPAQQKIAVVLQQQLTDLSAKVIGDLKKQEASNEFAARVLSANII